VTDKTNTQKAMTEFRREPAYPMLPVDEARQIIAAHIAPLTTEAVHSLSADGRVLAESVYADTSMPDIPKAAVDGYALRSDEGVNERRVLDTVITAGKQEQTSIEAGTAARIMTGAPVPEGASAVVMVEHTEERDGRLYIQQGVAPGANIRTIGEDIAADECVLGPGTVLGAAQIGLLAMLGRTEVQVYRRPRVCVLATGDELVEPDQQPVRGGVRDSNRYALMAAVREAGCEAISLGIARDDVQVQRLTLLSGIEKADMVITSGGVSMGTRDLIKPLLARLGTVHFGRVMFKPGKPTTFATLQNKPVFGLAGFPASSLVSFEVFVRPALRRMQGDANPERPPVRVRLEEAIRPSPTRPEYQRVVVRAENGDLLARSTGSQLSSRLLSMRNANALLLVPPGEETYAAGDTLEAILTGPIQI
jgi:molybdopterin molybdotransferase